MSSSSLRIALAQINCIVGDIAGNAQRIFEAAEHAHGLGAELLVTPELALCGYPPEDLLLRPDFYRNCQHELQKLAQRTPIQLLIGHIESNDFGQRFNAVSLLQNGTITATYHKRCLPNSDVLDEERYFTPGQTACVINIKDVRIGLAICEDIWQPDLAKDLQMLGAQVVLAINASPFFLGKTKVRQHVVRQNVSALGLPLAYINLVGGQDELIFDGASFALSSTGELRHQSPAFFEDLAVLDFAHGDFVPFLITPPQLPVAEAYAALCLGVRDYLGKNGFHGAMIGLSGGIDSALTLCIAVDALGAERVRAVMMPSPYTAQMSLDDAKALAKNLGVRYDEIPIHAAMQTFEQLLQPILADMPATSADTTMENIQARTRGLLMMAISNRSGDIVLTTGNKSEMAVGYATLYGDMAGGFAVLKDVYKTLVYELARWRNRQDPAAVIPENILTRAPSAELKPNQTDQDTLPPYEVLDAIIAAYMEQDLSPRQIIAQGWAKADVERVVKLLQRNEYKRRQAPSGIRITRRAFGKDWRYPITSRYTDEW